MSRIIEFLDDLVYSDCLDCKLRRLYIFIGAAGISLVDIVAGIIW